MDDESALDQGGYLNVDAGSIEPVAEPVAQPDPPRPTGLGWAMRKPDDEDPVPHEAPVRPERPDPETTTIYRKELPKPNNLHLLYLHQNPETSDAFDQKFGAGAAARYLRQPQKQPGEKKPDPMARPEISKNHVLNAHREGEKEDLPREFHRYIDRTNLAADVKKDEAVTLSMQRAAKSGEVPKEWDAEKELEEAETLLHAYELKAAQSELLGEDHKLAMRGVRLAETRVETARQILADKNAERKTVGNPKGRMMLATLLAYQMNQVEEAEARVQTAQGLDAVVGDDYAFAEDELRKQKATLHYLKEKAKELANTDKLDDATFAGETVRGLARGLFGQVPELLGHAMEWAGLNAEVLDLKTGEVLNSGTDTSILKGAGGSLKQLGEYVNKNIPQAVYGKGIFDIKSPTDLKMYLAKTLGEGIGTSAAIMIPGALVPRVGMAVGLGMGMGEVKSTLEREFAARGLEIPPEEMAQYVTVYGSAVGLLDTAGGLFALRAVSGAVKHKAGVSLARAIAVGAAGGKASEGVTEGLQEAFNILATEHAKQNGWPNITWSQAKAYSVRVMEAAVAGGIVGAAYGSVGGVHSYRNSKEREALRKNFEELNRLILEEEKTKAEEEAKAKAEGKPAPKSASGRETVEAKATKPIPEPKKEQAPQRAKDAATFIRERGGIADPDGELKAIGPPRGIINEKDGIDPDDMRDLLVQNGYITEAQGEAATTTEDLYEIVRRLSAGERVVPVGEEVADAEAEALRNQVDLNQEENAKILRDLESQLREDQVPYDLSDLEEGRVVSIVKEQGLDPFDAFERVALQRYEETGGRGRIRPGQNAQDTSLPFPTVGYGNSRSGRQGAVSPDSTNGGLVSEPGRATGYVAEFGRYLRDGGSLGRKAYRDIARQVGIQESEVGDLFEAAEKAGLVKQDRRGRYRRAPGYESILDQSIDSASSNAVSNMLTARLKSGKSIVVPDKLQQDVSDAIMPTMGLVPEGVDVGVLAKVVPVGKMTHKGKADIEVGLQFTDPRGGSFGIALPWSEVSSARAFFIPEKFTNTGRPAIVHFRLASQGVSDQLIAGGQYHELVHALRRTGKFGGSWDRLVAHAVDLEVLDMDLGTHLGLIGDPSASNAFPGLSVFDSYMERYKGRSDLKEVMAQEAVAHMIELRHHGYYTTEQMAPIADIIDAFESGALSGNPQGVMQDAGAVAALGGPIQQDMVLYRGEPANPEGGLGHHYTRSFERAKGFAGDGGKVYAVRVPMSRMGELRPSRDANNFIVPRDLRGGRQEVSSPGDMGMMFALSGNQPPSSFAELGFEPVEPYRQNVTWTREKPSEQYNVRRNKWDVVVGNYDNAWIANNGDSFVSGGFMKNDAFSNDADAPFVITGARVEESRRGQGLGVALYQALVDLASTRNVPLSSSGQVSPDARRVYESLKRRGYDVTHNGAVPADKWYAGIPGEYLVRKQYGANRTASGNQPPGTFTDRGRNLIRQDELGYYSKAVEAARSIKQEKGTPEQMLSQLRKAGVKEAEIEAVGLRDVMDGEKSVTKSSIIEHLERSRVEVREARYGSTGIDENAIHDEAARLMEEGNAATGTPGGWMDDPAIVNRVGELQAELDKAMARRQPKWSSYSLDPSNPTYRETVLHLPESGRQAALEAKLKEKYGDGYMAKASSDERAALYEAKKEGEQSTFRQSHFSDVPNAIAHLRTSIQPDAEGLQNFVINELQSDWGQKIRDSGGARDEAKIAELKERFAKSERDIEEYRQNAIEDTLVRPMGAGSGFGDGFYEFQFKIDGEWHLKQGPVSELELDGDMTGRKFVANSAVAHPQLMKSHPEYAKLVSDSDLFRAELRTVEASAPGHPLVNTTDQWVNTSLRRALRQAVESGADYIAIASGETVDSFGMGAPLEGLKYAYNEMYPKKLRDIIKKIDKDAAKPEKVATLFNRGGDQFVGAGPYVEQVDGKWYVTQGDVQQTFSSKTEADTFAGSLAPGFTRFPITEKLRNAVMDEGQPLFALAGRGLPDSQERIPSQGIEAPGRGLSDLIEGLSTALGIALPRHGRLNPGLKAMAGKAGAKLRGQHNSSTGVTRLAMANDIDTFSHEAGHAIAARYGQDLRMMIEAYAHELEPLASPGRDSLEEGFSEWFRRYIVNPVAAERAAPNFMEEFEDFLDTREPGMRDALDNVITGYQEWIDAPSAGVLATHVKTAKSPGRFGKFFAKLRKSGLRGAASDYIDGLYTQVIDDLHPIYRATQNLIDIASENMSVDLDARQSLGLTAARDPYKLLRLARNSYQSGHLDLMSGVRSYQGTKHEGPSFREAISKAVGGEGRQHWSDEKMGQFNQYLVARRMVQEWDRFKAGEIDNPPDGLSQGDHRQAIQSLEEANPSFRDGADMLYEFQNSLLTKAYQAGFILEDTYNDLMERADYVPVHRVMDDEDGGQPPGQRAKNNKNSLLKRFKGSTRDIINPLDSIARYTYELNFAIARNDAIKALDTLARAAGPGGGAIVERIPATEMRGASVNAIEVVQRVARDQGIDPADTVFMLQAIEETLGEDADTVIFKPGEMNERGEPILYLWEDGKRVALRLADGEFGTAMYEAITGLGAEWSNWLVNTLAVPSQVLRAGVTLDPAFILANYFRDQASAWMQTSDHGGLLPNVFGSAKASAEAFKDTFGGTVEDLDTANSFGLIMGGEGVASVHEARIKRDVKKLRAKGLTVREWAPDRMGFWRVTGVTETGTRLSVFRNARARAKSDGLNDYEALVEAAYSANDMIDFSRHGSRMLIARRLVTFLNAALQGMERSVRTGTGQTEDVRTLRDVMSPYIKQRSGQPLSVVERKQVSNAAKFWAKFGVISLIGLALRMLYLDDEEYEEMPEYFRDTHWIFRGPDNQWYRIPKPFELGAGSLILERGAEAVLREDQKAMERMLKGLRGLALPPSSVPGLQTALELTTNQKFGIGESVTTAMFKTLLTGEKVDIRPIIPDNMPDNMPAEMKYTAYTSELSKMLAQYTGIPAIQIDHIITGTTGSLGRLGLDMSNQIIPSRTPRPEMRRNEYPIMRRFTVNPARSSQSKREFWDRMGRSNGDFTGAAAAYKKFYDEGREDGPEADAYLKRLNENQRAYAVVDMHGTTLERRMHPLNRARDIISVTNGMRREMLSGELKKSDGLPYSPREQRVFFELVEQVQMREARNAMIVIREPGYDHLKTMAVESVMKELELSSPDLFQEMDYRLQKKKVQPFDVVRDGWPDFKKQLLDPAYVQVNTPRRKRGRLSP